MDHVEKSWVATAAAPSGSEEPLMDLLATRFGEAVTSYTDFEAGCTSISVFLDQRQDWNPAMVEELSSAWAQMYPGAAFPKFKLLRLRKRDWAEAWKRHFKTIRIGQTLIVRPPWLRPAVSPGCRVVVLEPGLSFGTGQHPTTGFCLREIVRYRSKGGALLDIGTGSGILAIAAAKLGYNPIYAIDNDPESIRVATKNAGRNKVEQRIQLAARGVEKLPASGRKYDLVCANLISNLLLDQADRIISTIAPNGVLALAGILDCEFPEIQRCFEAKGLKILRTKKQNEWRSGSFHSHPSAAPSIAQILIPHPKITLGKPCVMF